MRDKITMVLIIVLGIIASSAVAYAENGCHTLSISVDEKYRICKGSVSCSSGTVTWDGSGVFETYVKQNDGYGPRCHVSFCLYDKLYNIEYFMSEIEVHQNLCALKAGNIQVSHVRGNHAKYSIEEGSFLHSRKGRVHVSGFE